MHGEHHEAQKFSTTGCPRSDASDSFPGASSRFAVNAGARFPTFACASWCVTFQPSTASITSTAATAIACAVSFNGLAITRNYADTMKTGVPTSTWSNSHSASGMRIRMQPCEAE